MSKKNLLRVSALFIIIGIVLGFFTTDWSSNLSITTYLITLLGFVLAAISLRMPTEYVEYANVSDWIEQSTGNSIDYKLSIPSSKHDMGLDPDCNVYKKDANGNYKKVGVVTSLENNGSVIIEANIPIDCKIVIS